MDITKLYVNKEGNALILSAIADSGYHLFKAYVYNTYHYEDESVQPLKTFELEDTTSDQTLSFSESGDASIQNTILYVKVVETQDDVTESNPKIACTFYTKPIIDKLMTCIEDLNTDNGDMCSNAKRYSNLYLQFKSVSMSIRLSDFAKAEEYYNKFFNENVSKRSTYGGCNCHA